MSISTFNPWKIDAPFAPMFDESVTLVRLDQTTDTGFACVFPIETVDPFADASVENEAKRISVLLKKEGVSTKPEIGETIKCADNTQWSIAEIIDEQTWWKLTCRGGLA